MRRAYATSMKMLLFLTTLAAFPMLTPLAAGVAVAQAPDQRHGDQRSAFEARRTGRSLSLREIEARVMPMMQGAQYLGFDYDPDRGIYTLKFLRDGAVIWVDVDARTGQITGRSR